MNSLPRLVGEDLTEVPADSSQYQLIVENLQGTETREIKAAPVFSLEKLGVHHSGPNIDGFEFFGWHIKQEMDGLKDKYIVDLLPEQKTVQLTGSWHQTGSLEYLEFEAAAGSIDSLGTLPCAIMPWNNGTLRIKSGTELDIDFQWIANNTPPADILALIDSQSISLNGTYNYAMNLQASAGNRKYLFRSERDSNGRYYFMLAGNGFTTDEKTNTTLTFSVAAAQTFICMQYHSVNPTNPIDFLTNLSYLGYYSVPNGTVSPMTTAQT